MRSECGLCVAEGGAPHHFAWTFIFSHLNSHGDFRFGIRFERSLPVSEGPLGWSSCPQQTHASVSLWDLAFHGAVSSVKGSKTGSLDVTGQVEVTQQGLQWVTFLYCSVVGLNGGRLIEPGFGVCLPFCRLQSSAMLGCVVLPNCFQHYLWYGHDRTNLKKYAL